MYKINSNPITEKITIEGNFTGKEIINIYNNSGAILKTTKQNIINLDNYQNGTYIIIIRNTEKILFKNSFSKISYN